MSEILHKEEEYLLQIDGMDCSTCADTICSYLQKQGLSDVHVDYAGGIARFRSSNEVSLEKLSTGISGLGYKVIDASKPQTKSRFNPLNVKLLISATFTLPLLLHMFLHVPILHNPWFQLACAAPVMFIGIIHFGKTAFNALRLGVLHMDLLIIIGSSAAFIYSIIGVLYLKDDNYLFFETSASIISLVLLGNFLEHRAVAQTRRSLNQLQKAKPDKAIRINFYGMDKFEQTEEIETSQLLPSDIVLLRRGDAIAVDGEVLWGEAEVNEALISGESIPVNKQVGSMVLAGTTVVSGNLKVQVKKLGEQTTLSSIIKLMKAMQSRKVSIQRLADRITAVFVPIVISISVLTFLINYYLFQIDFTNSIMRSIAVLVISCPCAMGLATPTALMVGIGFAARKGILFKDASVIELIPRIKQIAFDKTGTLTTGNFSLVKTECFRADLSTCESWIVAMEKHSSHPIARSIVSALPNTTATVLIEVTEIAGEGIRATDDKGNKLKLSGYYQEETGYYGVELYVNDVMSCRMLLSDEIKTNTVSLIHTLSLKDITTILLSGDKEARVKQLASETGISQYFAEQKPDDKVKCILELKKNGPVMMVGDGINDAPALAAADVGISMAAQSGITTDAAQVVLLNNKIESLTDAIDISRLTYSTIKQNLFWAFIYNVVAIPLAAAGFLSPMLGAAAMAFSDLVVIGNSLLLRYKRLR